MDNLNHKKAHNGFNSKFGFIMATAGSAVGLGNLWAFPYKVGANGGAAFLIIYFAMIILVGSIAMIAEMYIGKRNRTNIVDSYAKSNKKFKWVGIVACITPFVILCYYVLIGGWSVKYAGDYIFGVGVAGGGVTDFGGAFASLISNPWIPIVCMLGFIFVAMFIIILGVKKGIEKVSKILMPLLLIIMVVVAIKGLTLEGADKGLDFFFNPDFSKITPGVVLAAMGQAFFSLSIGMGALVSYGSYMGKNITIGKSAIIVCGIDTLVAVLAGLVIFPSVFAFGLEPSSGPGLLFGTLTTVFANMSGGRFFGALFFVLVVLAAITSVISLMEVVTQYAKDKLKLPRWLTALIITVTIGIVACLVSLSMGAVPGLQIGGASWLDIFDAATNKLLMPIAALMGCVLVGWVIKPKNVIEEMGVKNVFAKRAYSIWGVLVKYVTPILIAMIFLLGFYEIFSGAGGMSEAAQWASVIFALAIIFGAILYNVLELLIVKKRGGKGKLAVGLTVGEIHDDSNGEELLETEQYSTDGDTQ